MHTVTLSYITKPTHHRFLIVTLICYIPYPHALFVFVVFRLAVIVVNLVYVRVVVSFSWSSFVDIALLLYCRARL
ncbi:hypothetical protein F4604DRAFT_1805847 [Suillus subluteus]|nr:hypothetical protein F4604DRAFT_1805847 [Suillus subluteus]